MTSHAAFRRAVAPDLILCLSHLRWDLVWQRPHHLMSRAARDHAVAYLEEPVPRDTARLAERSDPSGVTILTPQLPPGADAEHETRRLLRGWLARHPHRRTILWFYTPMALPLAEGLPREACVFDCMDDLAAFDFAPVGLAERERALMAAADVVFAGGRSLHEARKDRHPDVRLFPSSVDAAHFRTARDGRADPEDQAGLARPRVGFFGVIDERMDLDLVARTAEAMPEVAFVMLGPVVKVDPARLPRGPNLHWLGPKSYPELPAYLANWQAGWMPFALNASTRFISPTKTPEFLAAGLPVVSTAVPDVVRSYGDEALVAIADADRMPEALSAALAGPEPGWLDRVDARLSETSWDATWAGMRGAMAEATTRRARPLRALAGTEARP